MENIAGMLTFLLLILSMVWYGPLILRRRVKPAIATWIILFLAMNLATISYHAIPDRTLIENVTLYASALEITIIFILLVVVLWRSGEFKVAFDWMQKLCIVVMVMVVIYWAFNSGQSHVTFWATQTLLVVAYIATIAKAVQLRTAFDSIGSWSFIFASSIVGTIPAIMLTSHYGVANSIRAIVSSGITVAVLVYYDKKNDHNRWKDEKETLVDFYKIC